MQHFSNPVIATTERSVISAILGLEEVCVFIIIFLPYNIMGMTVNGVWPFEQTLNPVSTVGSTWNLVETGEVVSEESLFDKFIHVYSTGAGEDKPCRIKFWL